MVVVDDVCGSDQVGSYMMNGYRCNVVYALMFIYDKYVYSLDNIVY